jgi:hypothetical protein
VSIYYASVRQLRKMLLNLDGWLVKAAAHAEKKSFDPNILVVARLAPDQFALGRQVQAACDGAKYLAARVSGKDAPRHEDNEKTLDELRARVAAVVSYLDTFTEADFEGSDQRDVALSFAPGMVISAADYMTEMALPNTYFHLCMAYAILRHNGVELGKRDYLASMNLRPAT